VNGQYQPQYQQPYQNYQQPYQQPYQQNQNTNDDSYLDYLNGTIAYDPATDTTESIPLVVTDEADDAELQEQLFDFYITDIAQQHEEANDNEPSNWLNFLVEL
jgi:hypothetical protein